jgi:hypothetical protein
MPGRAEKKSGIRHRKGRKPMNKKYTLAPLLCRQKSSVSITLVMLGRACSSKALSMWQQQ